MSGSGCFVPKVSWQDSLLRLMQRRDIQLGCRVGVAPEDGAPEEEAGGQPTSPLTAVLPEAAMRLWTTVAATDAGVSTG